MILNYGVWEDCWESLGLQGDQASQTQRKPWVFIGRTDAEAETSILFPFDGKNWLTGKDPDAGKDWKQEEKGIADDEMVGSHHWLDGWSLLCHLLTGFLSRVNICCFCLPITHVLVFKYQQLFLTHLPCFPWDWSQIPAPRNVLGQDIQTYGD